MIIVAPINIIIDAIIFLIISFSLNIFAPKNRLTSIDSWNNARAYATFILAKT
jgi:hypothetical protein